MEYLDKDGYILIRENGRKIYRQHRVIVEQAIGRDLLPTEHVHHKDGNKQNNSLENLQIVSDIEHKKLHGFIPNILKCITCGATYNRKPSAAKKSKFCSNSCRSKVFIQSRIRDNKGRMVVGQ